MVPIKEQRLDVPTSGDARARARFHDARARFERDASHLTAETAAEFQSIARDYPDDPIAPYAQLYAGIAAIQGRAYDQALDDLQQAAHAAGADATLRSRSRLFLGIAENYLGRHQDALGHLRAGQEGVGSQAEQAEWLAAMAEATSGTGARMAALPYYDQWYEVASDVEKAYIVARLDAIAAEAGGAELRAAYEAMDRRDGPAAAVLGARVATDWRAQGRDDRAREVMRAIEPARRALGLAPLSMDGPVAASGGHPDRLGVVLPLSGRRARAGDLALRGVSLAADTFSGMGVRGLLPFEVSVRDAAATVGAGGPGDDGSGARAAMDALAGEGVIAVVGPIDGDSVDAAGARAEALGVPLLSLDPRSGRGAAGPGGAPYVFHIMQSAEDRAEALARHAGGLGIRRFAVMQPDNGYGRVVGDAFAAEVERQGGEVKVRVTYAPGATSFGDVIKQLRGGWDAIFVPDQAQRLELIAPALAAADLVSLPAGAREPRVGRKILLLSTAEFIAPRYLRNAGRYSEGAVLAPGFYPDGLDPAIRDFVERYQRAYGKLPTPLDAYAHDAVLVVSKAIAAGARNRAELSEELAAGAVDGLTGTISFDARRRRQDDGLLFVVVRDGGELAIRAMRD